MIHRSKQHIYSQLRAVDDPWWVIAQRGGESWTPQPGGQNVWPHRDPPVLPQGREKPGTLQEVVFWSHLRLRSEAYFFEQDFVHNKENWQILKITWQNLTEREFKKRECKTLPTQDLKPFQWLHVVWIHTYYDYKWQNNMIFSWTDPRLCKRVSGSENFFTDMSWDTIHCTYLTFVFQFRNDIKELTENFARL